MSDFLTAIGLLLILEGIPYFAIPERMRRMVVHMAALPDGLLRRTGLFLMCLGLLLVYLVRGWRVTTANQEMLTIQQQVNLSDAVLDLGGPRRPQRIRSKRFHGCIPAARLQALTGLVVCTTAAEVMLMAHIKKGLLRLHGQVNCLVEQACARCLTHFSAPLLAEVERLFVPGPDPGGADSQQEMEKELTYLADYRLSVMRVVEEELLLALPMIPLCRMECAGLCAGCGRDLNTETCLCVETTVDGPFAELKKLTMV